MNNKNSEQSGPVEDKVYIVGREGHIYISDIAVSKHHAEIKLVDGQIHLRDLDSTNGTYLFKDKKLIRFRAGYVQPDEPIVMGSKMYTARKLLQAIDFFTSD